MSPSRKSLGPNRCTTPEWLRQHDQTSDRRSLYRGVAVLRPRPALPSTSLDSLAISYGQRALSEIIPMAARIAKPNPKPA